MKKQRKNLELETPGKPAILKMYQLNQNLKSPYSEGCKSREDEDLRVITVRFTDSQLEKIEEMVEETEEDNRSELLRAVIEEVEITDE